MTDDVVEKYWALIEARHQPDSFAVLDAAYHEPQRDYHDFRHISDLLGKLDAWKNLAARVDLIAAAIFWHDAVYITREADGTFRPDPVNVRASAALFCRHSKFDQAEQDAVVEMILATIDHLGATASRERYPGFAADLDLFLDLDLSSLAAPWPEFEQNLARIRYEFSWISEIVFCTGRLQMAENFGGSDRLFRRAETRAQWLLPAQENLRRSTGELRAQLARLSKGG